MTQLIFEPNKRLRHPQSNALARATSLSVLNGCVVSENAPADMTVDISSGEIIFDGTKVTVGSTNKAIGAAHATLYRLDLVLVDNTGTVTILQGTSPDTQATVIADEFDTDTYICLSIIEIPPTVITIVNAYIIDNRVLLTSAPTTGTEVIRIESMLKDLTHPPGDGLIGLSPCLEFDENIEESAYFSFLTPVDYDDTVDMTIRIAYCMSATNSSDAVVLGLDVVTISDTAQADLSLPDDATTQTITVPDTQDELDIVSLTTIKIAAGILSGQQTINCRFYRDATNASDTATGDFRLISFEITYTKA